MPEVASRHHVEVITACIEEALAEAGITENDVTAVAVTYGPGLVGALLVGLSAAKAFAWAHRLPLIPVNPHGWPPHGSSECGAFGVSLASPLG